VPRYVLLLHGLGGTGAKLARHFSFGALSRELGFTFEAPDGDVDASGRAFWNAGPACCDFDGRGIDHVASLGARLDQARARLGPDARLFVVGYSNGGFMAHRLACDRTGIDGILSVAGPSPTSVASCDHAPRRVLHVHGDADDVVAFEGGHVFQMSSPHASAEASVLGWAKRSGCDASLSARGELDLERTLDGPETLVMSPPCDPRRVLFRVRGGSHAVAAGDVAMRVLLRELFAE
jgi:polyhydroxybutyrate depolymerase